MLTALRKATRTWVAGIFVGLLVLSFAIFGINDIFQGATPQGAARVDGQLISSAEYKAEFDRVLERARREAGRSVTAEEAAAQGVDSAVLNRMIDERALAALTGSLGIVPAEAAVRREIGNIEAFQDPNTGQFSPQAYDSALRSQGYSAQGFETQVRQDMARQTLFIASTSGIRAPGLYARQTLYAGTERRQVSIIAVPARLVAQPGEPTDAQLQQLYDENRARLMRPETRSLVLASAIIADFTANVRVDEAEVRAVFERAKTQRATPATRTLQVLQVRDAAQAAAVEARIKAGEEPAAVATALGLPAPLSYDAATEAQVPDTAVARAAFAARPGAVQTVTSPLGMRVIRVSAATEQVLPSFESLAPEIRTELRNRGAQRAMIEAAETFDAAIAEGVAFEQAATRAGLRLVRIPAITAQGTGPDSQPVPEFADQQSRELLLSAFQLQQGEATDLLPMGEDTFAAAYVAGVVAPSPVPFAEVRPDLREEWRRRQISASLETRANAIAAEARTSSLEAAARSAGLQVERPDQPLQRGQGSPQLSQAVFAAKKGEIVVGLTANGVEYAVIRIENIERDDETAQPQRLQQAEQSVRQSIQQDIVATIEVVARERAEVTINRTVARTAIGLVTDEETAESAAAAATAPAGAGGTAPAGQR